ncbi:hypothetical protein COBT_002087 [Conglomerata obtusa]
MNIVVSASVFVSTCLFTYNQFTGNSNETSVTTSRAYTTANIAKSTPMYTSGTSNKKLASRTLADLAYKGYGPAKPDIRESITNSPPYTKKTDDRDSDNATAKTVKVSYIYEQKNNTSPKVIIDNITKSKYNNQELKEIKGMIKTCYENYKIACQYRESDDLVLEAKKLKSKRNQKYTKLNVKDMCKKDICHYDNDEQNCFEKHNYYLLKNIRECQRPHCVSSAVTHINNELVHKQILRLNDISKLKFRGFIEPVLTRIQFL